jgi:hypothetical protein
MTNELQIKLVSLLQFPYRYITTINSKYCDRLSSKIMSIQINTLDMFREQRAYVTSLMIVGF